MSHSNTSSKRRVLVISDLHLGGVGRSLASHPEVLTSFLEENTQVQPETETELVIAGDFVDFLASAPIAAFCHSEREAEETLRHVAGQSPEVFRALAAFAATNQVTVLVGNHDVELGLPRVQRALHELLGPNLRFIDDGRAYRVGPALIEHGNDFDGANMNDWNGLRLIRAFASRGLPAPVELLNVSAGSEIVFHVVNPLKQRYPFIDLLQPEGIVLALLLLAFEPTLAADFQSIARLLAAQRKQAQSDARQLRAGPHLIAAVEPPDPPPDQDLTRLFGQSYEALRRPALLNAAPVWYHAFRQATQESLATYFDKPAREGETVVPPKRLEQIRVALARMLENEASADLSADCGVYGTMAERMFGSDTKVVIMGHTHQARYKASNNGTYVNTGTWADVIRIPQAALESIVALEQFLRLLCVDGARQCLPHYAELRYRRDELERVDLHAYRHSI